jgi:hypothetical protein
MQNSVITLKQFSNFLGLKYYASLKREYDLHLKLVGKSPEMKLTLFDLQKIYPNQKINL